MSQHQQQQQQQYGYGPPQAQYGGYPQQQYYQPQYAPPPHYPAHPHPHHQQQQQHAHMPPPPPAAAAAPPAAAPPAAAPGVPYIGARISLVSNMNIRYEGTLYTIDTKASTVALQNVRCFGTETRGADGQGGGGFVPPSADIYEFIIFGGQDIKDLAVLQPEPQQQQPLLQDPPAPAPPQDQPAPAEPVQTFEQPAQAPQQPHQQQGRQPRSDRQPRGGRQPQQAGAPAKHTVRILDEEPVARRAPAWSGASSGVAAVQSQPAAAPAPAQTTEENKAAFDFQSSNARFEKLESKHEDPAAAGSVPSYDLPSADSGLDTSGFPVVTKKYDAKKSFFDELPSGRAGPSGDRRVNMRAVDADTFGADASGYRSQHGRGGRSGGQRGPRRQGGGGQQQQGGAGWRQDGQ